MKALENKNPNDEQQDSDDKKIKFATGLAPNRFAEIDIFCALDSFWRQLECPGKNHRHWKSDNEQQHHKPHGPIRNFKERKNLAGDLHQQPRDDCVSNRNLVNVASLQLGEELIRVHGNGVLDSCTGTIFSTSASNRGSPRSGSSNGLTFMSSKKLGSLFW